MPQERDLEALKRAFDEQSTELDGAMRALRALAEQDAEQTLLVGAEVFEAFDALQAKPAAPRGSAHSPFSICMRG